MFHADDFLAALQAVLVSAPQVAFPAGQTPEFVVLYRRVGDDSFCLITPVWNVPHARELEDGSPFPLPDMPIGLVVRAGSENTLPVYVLALDATDLPYDRSNFYLRAIHEYVAAQGDPSCLVFLESEFELSSSVGHYSAIDLEREEAMDISNRKCV
jgi:hypothetical protein